MAKNLKVPHNITLMHLPPYSPELNPVERLWAYIRSRYLRNQAYDDYQQLFDVASSAWNKISSNQFKTICNATWLMHEN